jgi:hypothetical protein
MSVEKLPVVDLDNVNHRRRARETINLITSHQHDDSRVQTTGERLAGVTPTNYAYPPGDIRRYGAVADTESTSVIQTALDVNHEVFIPDGNWLVSSPGVKMNDYNVLRFQSRNAKFIADFGGAIIASKNANTGVLEDDENRVHWQIHGGYIDGTDSGNAGSIAIDVRGSKMCKMYGTYIQNVEKAVRGNGDEGTDISVGCYYNDFFAVDIQNVVYGYHFGSFANDNHVFGGRVNSCTYGTYDDNNSANAYFGLAIEVFTYGHVVAAVNPTQNIRFISSRLENLPSSGTGFVINSQAQDTWVYGPHMAGLTTTITDSGIRSNISSSEHFSWGSSTFVRNYLRGSEVINFGSISANSELADRFISIPGALSTASVFATPPASIEAGLSWVAIPASSGAYVRLRNNTGAAIDPASGTWTIDVWNHV